MKNTPFRPGDKVVHVMENSFYEGMVGTVVESGSTYTRVEYETGQRPKLFTRDLWAFDPASSLSVNSSNPVNPEHYKFGDVQVIDITKHLNFLRGSVVKYVARAGRKSAGTELQDLEKALKCLQEEIARVRS